MSVDQKQLRADSDSTCVTVGLLDCGRPHFMRLVSDSMNVAYGERNYIAHKDIYPQKREG